MHGLFTGILISLMFLVFERMAIDAMLWHALLIIRMTCMDHGSKKPTKYEVVVNALDILHFSFGWVSGFRFFYEKPLRQIVRFVHSSYSLVRETERLCTERSGLLIEWN
jgi:hypothetical protein